MKKLIITEKPSVGRNIASALDIKGQKQGYIEGNEYIISWAFGHLLQLCDSADYDEKMLRWELNNFPFIPDAFKYKIKKAGGLRGCVDEGAKKQIDLISSLAKREDVSGIILATDWDREGQIIGDEIINYIDVQKPVERLLLNEWTDEEVKGGLGSLKPNLDMGNMSKAGFSRQQADWLIGINLTSVATVKYRARKKDGKSQMLSIGRVILPTLKIIYDRDMEIENFESTSYFKLQVKLSKDDKSEFMAIFQDEDGKEQFPKEEALKEIAYLIKDSSLTVSEKEIKEKREKPPLLFNLSALQGFITAKHRGWTGEKVLKVAQDLYEKKLITYPRTASMVLDESIKDKAAKVLEVHKTSFSFSDEIKFKELKRIFDSSKVESHSAIMPTYVKAKNLSKEEEVVYDAVLRRFIAQFMKDAVKEETKVVLTSNMPGNSPQYKFIAKGSVEKQQGFKMVEQIGTKEEMIPDLSRGDIVNILDVEIKKITRKPPKHHNEKTLLKVMETCGKHFSNEETETEDGRSKMMEAILSGFFIGTPATRGETIAKLKRLGYIDNKGKYLISTNLGKKLVENFPVRELFDLDYTGKIEQSLSDIERGKISKEEFIAFIKEFTKNSVEKIKVDKGIISDIGLNTGETSLGNCPICGNPIIESEKAFGCKAWQSGCKFTIWKKDSLIESLGKEVTPEFVSLLLKNGKVGYRRLRSKKGTYFPAYIVFDGLDENGRIKWKLDYINKN